MHTTNIAQQAYTQHSDCNTRGNMGSIQIKIIGVACTTLLESFYI